MTIRLGKLTIELQAAGIPIDGVSSNGFALVNMPDEYADAVIQYRADASPSQRTQGDALKAAHDGTLPFGFVSVLTTGPKLIALVGADGQGFVPSSYMLFVRSAVNLTGVPTVSLGTNAPTYNNLIPSTPLTGWVAGDVQVFVVSGRVKAVLTPTPVYLNVTVAATGTSGAIAVIGARYRGEVLVL